MKLIERKLYLNKLINVIGTPDIKIIARIRRAGKSKLMDAFIEYIKEKEENYNIVRIKLTLKEYEDLKNPQILYNYVIDHYKEKMTNYL